MYIFFRHFWDVYHRIFPTGGSTHIRIEYRARGHGTPGHGPDLRSPGFPQVSKAVIFDPHPFPGRSNGRIGRSNLKFIKLSDFLPLLFTSKLCFTSQVFSELGRPTRWPEKDVHVSRDSGPSSHMDLVYGETDFLDLKVYLFVATTTKKQGSLWKPAACLIIQG